MSVSHSPPQVKNLFKRIFSLPEGVQLVGGALPDAIVLSPIGDQHTFYVLMRPEDPGDQGWEAKELVSEGTFMWTHGTPFRTVMYFLSQSSGGLLQGDSDHEVLMPFPEIQEKSEVTSHSKNPEVMSLSEISEVTSRSEISEVTSRSEISEVTSRSEISEVTS
jgi:hypothetical protein